MTAAEVEADRFTAVEDIALRYGGVTVLKGAGSLIASQIDGQVALCTNGNPGMASGGMGDVLTGVIAGLVLKVYAVCGGQSRGLFTRAGG